jgi:GH25 family lysozyme M1 (1,4-beta-N-acetylmuramidase)
MYIIGFRVISLLAIFTLLSSSVSAVVASESDATELVDNAEVTCIERPQFEPLIGPKPNRNRPFAFNPAMQRIDGIFGIDISRWDHPGDKLLDFPKINRAGFEYALIKLSDGATVKSHRLAGYWWRIDRPLAEKAGFLVGGYHFAYPRGTTALERRADALKQAQMAAMRYGKWQIGRLPLVLDLEVHPAPKWSPREITDWALTFLEEAERLTNQPPMIYSYANYFLKHMEPDLRMVKYPLWVAHYGVHLGAPAQIAPWSLFDGYAVWQFSSSARTPGTHRNIGDLNVTSAHWLNKLSGKDNNFAWAQPLAEVQVDAFNSIARGGNGQKFHNRTGSSREGLTTWKSWVTATSKCPLKPIAP